MSSAYYLGSILRVPELGKSTYSGVRVPESELEYLKVGTIPERGVRVLKRGVRVHETGAEDKRIREGGEGGC